MVGLFFFFLKMGFHVQICYVAMDGFEPLISCWDYRHEPPHPVHVGLSANPELCAH